MYVEVSITFCHTTKTNLVSLFSTVFFSILLCFFEDDSSLFFQTLLTFNISNGTSNFNTFQVLSSLEKSFGNCRSCIRHYSVDWLKTLQVSLISVTICKFEIFICPH